MGRLKLYTCHVLLDIQYTICWNTSSRVVRNKRNKQGGTGNSLLVTNAVPINRKRQAVTVSHESLSHGFCTLKHSAAAKVPGLAPGRPPPPSPPRPSARKTLMFPPFHPTSNTRSSRSNPVPIREEWDPIPAEQSLTAAFKGTSVSGQWVLRLRDTTVKELNDRVNRAAAHNAHGDGGVAGWEVML